MNKVTNILLKLNTPVYIFLIVFIAVILSELLVIFQSYWIKGSFIETDFLIIGFITSFIDSIIIAFISLYLMQYLKKDIIMMQEKNAEIKKLKDRMALAFDGSNDAIWDWDFKDKSLYISKRWHDISGFEGNLLSKVAEWKKRIHPDDYKFVMHSIFENIRGNTEYLDIKHRIKHLDGHWIWIHMRGKTQFDENGKAVRMTGTQSDISKDIEIQLKNIQQAQIIQQIHDSVITTDLKGYIIDWNLGSEHMFGYSADEVIGKHVTILHDIKNFPSFKKAYATLIRTGSYTTDVSLIKKSKEHIYVSLSTSILKDENDNPISMVGYLQDISKRKKAEDELYHQKNALDYQAHHDSLTGLPNRVLFHDRLEQGIEKSKRKNKILALFFIDLDHFKEINDSLGHDVGDKMLKIVTDRLKKRVRDEDTIARLGGDEFTIIVENLAKGEDASFLAQKIIDVLSLPIDIDDNQLYISSSIGISLYPNDGLTAQNLLKYADAAMYKAKDEGRNNFQFYSSQMTELMFEKVVMTASLRVALKNQDFIIYYQPQVDAMKNKITGMEALVRWQHQTMGIVSPAKFIPLLESTGLIVELDRFVLKSVMTQIVSWRAKGIDPGVVAMNLSVRQLQQKDFLSTLKSLIKETGCKAEWIALEVTESQIMTNPEEAIKILNKISDEGIELAVDDFGTGYSSLAYLKKLPIDKLKIDQVFVMDLPYDEEDSAITKAVIALAKSLNLSVIAEGVEKKEQKDFLIQNGCENIQGYLYSKPIPANEIEKLLEQNKG